MNVEKWSRWIVIIIWGEREPAICYERYTKKGFQFWKNAEFEKEVDEVFVVELCLEICFDDIDEKNNLTIEEDDYIFELNLSRLETLAIQKALEISGGCQKEASKLLGITPRQLHYKLLKMRKG